MSNSWNPPTWLFTGAVLRPKPPLVGGKTFTVKAMLLGESDIDTKVRLSVDGGAAQERIAREVVRDFVAY